MPGFGNANTDGVTVGRKTTVLFDISESVMNRTPRSVMRRGGQVNRAPSDGARGTITTILPSGAWTVAPYQILDGWELAGMHVGVVRIGTTGWEVARHGGGTPLFVEKPFGASLSALAGTVPGAGAVTSSTDYFLMKQVPAGSTFAVALAGDALSYAAPALPSANLPMRRVAITGTSFAPNTGFCLRFIVPPTGVNAPDGLLTFYFGGAVEHVRPAGARAGEFALAIRGDGTALLFERAPTTWRRVLDFRWGRPGGISQQAHRILVLPHSNDRIEFVTGSTDNAQADRLAQLPGIASRPPSPHANTFSTARPVTTYTAKSTMTGRGPVRLDMREDLFIPVQVSLLAYPGPGTLYDQPFSLPFRLPAETPITLVMDTYEPEGTSIVGTLMDAQTLLELLQNADGTWQSLANKHLYQVRFTFSATQFAAPVLYGYEAYVSGYRTEVTKTPLAGGTPQSWSITAGGEDPTQDSANLQIADLKSELGALRLRGRIRSKIITRYDPADQTKTMVLFEGETNGITAKKIGKTRKAGFGPAAGAPDVLYPHPEARRYDVNLAGIYARTADQFSFVMKSFHADPTAGFDPEANYVPFPWKLTDIIQWIFEQTGTPPDQIQIDPSSMRAFTSGREATEYLLQPTANLMEFIRNLVKNYLGFYMVYDPNAGSRGMWRVKAPPRPPYTPLWHFQSYGPGAGKLIHVPGAYPANTSFVSDWETFMRPPEANFIVVTAIGELLPNHLGATILTQFAFNPNSFNFDPTHPTMPVPPHPDKLDRFVPFVWYEPNLTTQRGVDVLTRRLYNRIAKGQKWVRFRGPLPAVPDPSDSHLGGRKRPPRYYDPITFNGYTALIQSVRMECAGNDRVQMVSIEAQFVDNTLVV